MLWSTRALLLKKLKIKSIKFKSLNNFLNYKILNSETNFFSFVIPPPFCHSLSFVIPVKTGIQEQTIQTLKTNKKFKTAIMLLLNFLFILLKTNPHSPLC